MTSISTETAMAMPMRSELLDAAAALAGAAVHPASADTTPAVRASLETLLSLTPEAWDGPSCNIVLLAVNRFLVARSGAVRGDVGTIEKAFAVMEQCLGRAFEDAAVPRVAVVSPIGLVHGCVAFLPDPSASEDTLRQQPEELRAAILRCLRCIFQRLVARQDQQALLTAAHLNMLAFMITALLFVGEKDRCRPNALLSLETLVAVLQFLDDGASNSTLHQFFPGIVVGVLRCVNAPQQPSSVIQQAIVCLAFMLGSCASDAVAPSSVSSEASTNVFDLDGLRSLTQAPRTPTSDPVATSTTLNEEQEWFRQCANNVDVVLPRLFGHRLEHKSWRVRCALVDLCEVVTLRCRRVLWRSFVRCYEQLILMRMDPVDAVESIAKVALDKLHAEVTMSEWLTITPALAERFQIHLSSLALQVSSELEAQNVVVVWTLIGYCVVLGSRIQTDLELSVASICKSLCSISKLSAVDANLLVNTPVYGGVADPLMVSEFKKRLDYFHEEASVAAVELLVRSLGSCISPAVMIDAIFGLLESETEDASRAEPLFVLNCYLQGFLDGAPGNQQLEKRVPSNVDDSKRVFAMDVYMVGRLLDDLLVLDTWAGRSKTARPSSVWRLEMTAILDIVGSCAQLLGREFDPFLLNVLSPVVEKLGAQDAVVERAALASLHRIYYCCGYESLHAPIQANADYFMDTLCTRLEHLDAFPSTPYVAEGLLRLQCLSSLPLIEELALALMRSIDLYQHSSEHCSPLLHALSLTITNMSTFVSTNKSEQPAMEDEVRPSYQFPLITRFISEINALHAGQDTLPEESNDDDESSRPEPTEEELARAAMPISSTEDEDGEQQDPNKKPHSLIVSILDRSTYFLATDDPMTCCKVLQTITEGLKALSVSKTELLPMVHRLWPSLLHRLDATNRPIVIATCTLLTTMTEIAADFIGDRFVEHVWPRFDKIVKAMQRDAESGLTRASLVILPDASSSTGHADHATVNITATSRNSNETKLLRAILGCVASMARQTRNITSIVPSICSTFRTLLRPELPQDLKDAIVEALVAVARLNADEVFFMFAPAASWEAPQPPPAFPSYKSTFMASSGYTQTSLAGKQVCRASAAGVLQRMSELRL